MYGLVPNSVLKLSSFPERVPRQAAIIRWYVVGAAFRAMGSTSYLYTPRSVTKAVYCLLSSAKCIWSNPS